MRINDLKAMPGHLVRRAQQSMTVIFSDETEEFDLTSVQFVALVAINDVEALDATRLAALIHFDRATIGGVIERLERKGLVERKQSENDKRIKVLKATDKGRELIASCFECVEEVQRRFLAPLDMTEQAEFLRLLRRLCGESSGK